MGRVGGRKNPFAFFGWALVFCAVSVLAGGDASAQESLGPLEVAEHNPLYRLYYVPRTESADVVGDGRLRFDLATSYSNIHEASRSATHRQLFDLERMTNTLTVRYGVWPSVELGGRLSFRTGWGGFLDPFVSGFHRALGLPNGGRELEPDNQHVVRLERSDSSMVLDLPPTTMAREDLRLFAKVEVLGGPEEPGTLSLRGTIRRSAGRPDSGRTDAAVALLGRASRGMVHLHGTLGVTTLTPPSSLEAVTQDAAATFSVAVEGQVRPGLSLIGQFVGASRYIDGFEAGELDQIPMTFVVGVASQRGDGWAWQFSFAEDLPPNSPSVDFTFDFQIARTF